MKLCNLVFLIVSTSSLYFANGEMTVYPEDKYIFSDSFEDGLFEDEDEFFEWSSSNVVDISSVSLEEGNTAFRGQSYVTNGEGGPVSVVKENLKPIPISAYGTVK